MKKKTIKPISDLRKKMADHMHDVRKKLGSIDQHLDNIKRDMKEEEMTDDINEVSKDKLNKYLDKAEDDMHKSIASNSGFRARKRIRGTHLADKKVSGKGRIPATEETNIEEGKTFRASSDDYASAKKDNLTRALKKSSKLQKKASAAKRNIEEEILDEAGLVVGTKVRVTNPKATPRYTLLSVGNKHVKVRDHAREKDIKFLKSRVKKANGIEEENLDELSKKTLGNYVKAAVSDVDDKAFDHGGHFYSKDGSKDKAAHAANKENERKLTNRKNGISKAVDKIVKEESVDEAKTYMSHFRTRFGNYLGKSPDKYGTTFEVGAIPKSGSVGTKRAANVPKKTKKLKEEVNTIIKSKQYREALKKANDEERHTKLMQQNALGTTGGNTAEYS